MRKLALIATICLTCIADVAWALGVGNIELYSALNQPLQAEIPLFSLRAGESSLVNVALAPDSAFARAGRQRADILSNLRFRVVPGPGPDRAVIQVTTTQPVREPFLSMLLEVSWPDGRLVREYTVLLDPPVIAQSQATRRPATDFNRAPTTSPLGSNIEKAPEVRAEGGSYGPVRQQETLWSIAYATRPDESVSMDQMMQAIYQANPDAFDGDITRIRAGVMLRIPDASEIGGVRSAPRERSRQPSASTARPAPVETGEVPEPAATSPSPTASGESQPATKPQGELRLSKPEESASASGDNVAKTPTETEPEAADEGADAAPPAETDATTAKVSAPIQVRDNSAKALELLAAQAREQAVQQPANEPAPAPVEVAPPPAQAGAATPETPATPAEAPAPAAPATAPPAATSPEAAPANPAPDSPFADESPVTTPGAEQAPSPPAEEAPPAASKAPAPPKPAVADEALPTPVDEASAFNPMLLGLVALAVLLLGLGAASYRKYRARKDTVQLAPIVLSTPADDLTESPFADTLEPPARPERKLDSTLGNAQKPAPAARSMDSTLQSTLQSTMPPAQTTQQFMAVSAPEPTMPAMVEASDAPSNDPFADVLGEVDIHIAYGLYDEAARLLQEPLTKSPERKDLHLKMLEVHFSANMPEEFEAQAKKMKAVLRGSNDPDWEKVCIMGRQLCPNSMLFGEGGDGAVAGLSGSADLDLSSMLGGANTPPATPAAAKPAPAPSTPAASKDLPALDLDLSGFNLGVEEASSKPSPTSTKAAAPASADKQGADKKAADKKPDDGNLLDFDLSDFSLDTPAEPAAAKPKAEAKPAAKAAPAADEGGLDIDLSDFDLAGADTPASTPTSPASAASAGATDDGDLSLDDLISSESGGGEGADTRLDLARAYIDMGEPTMAKTLLEEVMAQGSADQKQEAQELLGKLATS